MCWIGEVAYDVIVDEKYPIIGWKIFRLYRKHFFGLGWCGQSLYFNLQVHYKKNRVYQSDLDPTKDNQHGLWCFRNCELARNVVYSDLLPGMIARYAIRKVLLWGTVVKHETGYRAEFMKIC